MANAHIGRVETIDGGVTVTPLSGSESPLTQGMPVYMNDLIKTDADASVRLRLHDGSSLLIDAGQTISLDANLVDVSGSGILISEDSVTAITVTGITTVSSVEGNVQVVRGGVPRELVAGDLLYPGDTLIAAADGSAVLQLSDGSETVIEPGSQSRLGGSEAAQREGEFLTSGIDDPAEIQAAILAGRDPSQDAPAPGVGETDSNEGHTHIRILPSGRAVTPDSGHETHGQDLPISFDIEELLQDQDSIPDLNVTYIAGGPGVVDEAGLSNGSSSNDGSATTTGSFTINTGNDQLATFEVQDQDGNWIDVTAGNVMVQGVNGVLTVTLNNGVYNWSYDLTTNLTTHTDTDPLDGDSDRGAADQVPGDLFPVRVIDSDGDISPPASIDIVVNDDGPSVTSTALPVDALQVDESLLAQDAQLDVSGQFAIVAGADQPAAVNYALTVPGGDGTDSGLVDAATGQRILLSEVNGVIQGRTETGGDLVFTLSVNGSGVVTLDQLRALRHPDGTDPDDVLNLASPDLVQLTATVTDADGDTASAALDLGSAISFRDDGPQAVDDIAGTGEDAAITYNVLGNDVAGADGPATVTAASLASGQGTVTYLPNGDITVTPVAGYEGPIVVNYTIVDSDGDPSSATLTVNVALDSVPALSIQDGTVDEAALPAGSNAASPNEAASGGFGINTGGDSVGTLVINGVDVTGGGTVAGAYGTLTVTLSSGIYSWDYLLNANAPHPDATSTGTAEGIGEQFNVVLTDSDGDVVNDVLDIAILDDGPQAVDDIAGTGEDAAITYNVLGNDVAGADGPATVTAASLASGQGTVTYLPNGDITVTPSAGYEGPIVVSYTIVDSDGDPSSATLTVNVALDSVPALSIQDGTVDEAALPAGSNDTSPNEAASGGFGINTGGDSVGTLVINGVDVTGGGTVVGAYGTLTVTLSSGIYSWDYLLNANAPHPDATSTGTAEGIGEQFNVVLTDSDGDVVNDVLDIAILDDGPQAVDDIAATGEDAMITYNVLGNDIAGADGPATVTAASLASGQGTVTFLSNGDLTVTPSAGYEGPIVVNYTIVDSDGDPSTATLTVNVALDSVPALSIQDGTVDEAALPAGSNAASPNEAASGGFGINTGGDSVGTLVINGVDVTGGGTVVGAYGTLTVTLSSGIYSWDYLLNANAPHPDTTSTGTAEGIGEQFNVVLTDSDGDVVNDVLDIAILDDGPQAVDDIAATGEDATITYNVLGNDVAGADGPATVTAASLASGQGTVTFLSNGDLTVTPSAGYEGPIVVNYTIVDSDGDPSSATLTVNVALDSVPALSIQDGTVDEAALPAGSNDTSPNEAASGGFGINTGGDSVGSLVINGVDVTGGGTVAGAYGTLTVTLSSGIYSWDYLLNANAPHPDTSSTGTAEGIGEQFNVVLTDSDGDVVNDVLDIAILDDGPQAVDDIAATGEDATITYNVLGNDIAGADGPATVTAASLASGQGTVTFLPNGDITVTPSAGYEGPIVVNYTIVDSDGDPSSATLTVNVALDSVPALSIQDGTVDEAALPAGSNDTSPNEAASGGFGINTGGDSVGSLVINGVDVTGGGTVAGAYGTLTVTLSSGIYSWDYLLNANAPHPDTSSTGTAEGIGEQFNVVLTDSDGDVVNDVLDIAILDDGPQAVDDIAATGEDATITYNVLGNDIAGADGPATVTAASLASGQGTVTFLPNGDITVTPSAGYEGPIVVNYTIVDSDGDPSSATLTVNVALDSVPALSIQDGTVDEAALPAGSNDTSPNEAASGGFGINTGGDSVGSLVINGVDVTGGGTVVGAYGTLTVTLSSGVYSWDYLLNANAPHPDATSTGTAEGIGEQFNVVLTDSDGDVVNDVLDIAILDDGPQAVDDIAATGEDATITYNVLGNDVAGADGPATVTAASLASGQGTVTFLPNGDLTVTPSAGYEGPIVVSYTIVDSDGDPSSATLTVTVDPDSVPALSIQDGTVDEAALPAGSNAASPNEAASGGFGINTGGDSVGTLVINGVDVTGGGTVVGAYGTLTVTLSSGIYSWDYLLNANAPHPDATSTGTAEGIGEQFNVVLTDSDGDVVNDVLDIAILDDGPQAVDDTNAIIEDAVAPVTGAVLGNDIAGADDPAAFVAWADTAATYGTFTDTGGGNYSYVLNNSDLRVQGLDEGQSLTETFTYTMMDADGDTSVATLTITINGSNDVPVIVVDPGNPGGANDQVFEAALSPKGSDPTSTGEFAYGQFTLSDADSLADLESVTINGTTVLLANLTGASFTGSNGTLTVTAYDAVTGVATYTYELTAPTTDVAGIESDDFTLTVSDGTADSLPASIIIEIVDDVPSNFEPTPVILVNSGDGSGSGPLDAFGNIGADDLGSVVFTGGADGDLLTGLFNGNTTAEPVMYKGEEIILTGFGTGTLTGISKDSNTVILEIKLNPDTSDGSEDLYTITFFTNINDGSGIVFDNFSTAPAGQKKWVGLDSDGLDINDPADPNPDSPDLLITAYSNGVVANVNTSSTDIGANNQWIAEDQVIRLDFVTDVARDTAAGENERDVEGFVYDSHYAVNNFAFKVLQVQGGGTAAVRIKASNFIGTEGDTDLANSLNNTAVAIILGSLIINGVAASSLPGISVTVDGDSIVIEGLAKGDEVFFSADDTFESVEISDANGDPDGQNSTYSGDDFSVGGFNISSAVEGDEIDLSFDLLATDGDGDTATGSLDVTISPEGHVATGTDLDEVLIGDSSVDILNGGGGDDILIGNNGDDILTGGAGADIFIWTDGQSGNDTVTDFSLMEGDVLNIADLLIGEDNPTAADLDNDYMSIASGSDTVITVFGNDGNADQVIQLAGYDTTGLSSVQIIENLLGNGNLLTD